MKRAAALLIACMLGLAALCGCTPPGSTLVYPDYPNTPADNDSWTYIDEEFTIDWYVDYSWFTYQSTAADIIGQRVKELTGVTINFTSPVQNDSTNLNLMISGDTLPDVISVRAYQQRPAQLALEGYVYPVDELARRWAPTLLDRIEPDIADYYSIGDHLYGLPNCAYSEKYVDKADKWEPNGAMLVRKDWYEWYTSQPDAMDITTKAGLKDAMTRVRAQFQTPSQRVVPMLLDEFTGEGNQSITWLSQYFAAPFEDENGNYVDSRFTDQYFEALTYLSELYGAGLLSGLSNDSDAIGQIISRGEAFVTLVTPQNYTTNFTAAYRGSHNVEYIPLIVRNDAGDDPILQDMTGRGWLLSMITKNCERPDLVIKVFDFLYSEEGQRLTNFGIENDTWRWADEEHTAIEWTDKYVTQKLNGGLENYGLEQLNVLYNPAYVVPLMPVNALQDYELYIKNLKRPLSAFSYRYTMSWPKLDKTTDEYTSVVNAEANCLAVWSEYLPDMISGDTRTQYDTAIAQMQRRGLDNVLAYYAQAYADGKTAAGVERAWIPAAEEYVSPTLRNEDGSYSDTPVGANGDPYYLLG